MKLKFLAFSILVFNLCYSQNQPEKPAKVELVKVTDWGQYTMIPPYGFWESGESEIINQIGKKEFELVKTFSKRENIPCQMQLFCEDVDGSPKKNFALLKEKQGKLIVYRIARALAGSGDSRGEAALKEPSRVPDHPCCIGTFRVHRSHAQRRTHSTMQSEAPAPLR